VIYSKLSKPDHNVMLQPTENNTNQKKKEKIMGRAARLGTDKVCGRARRPIP
jgi:hypothetical protein